MFLFRKLYLWVAIAGLIFLSIFLARKNGKINNELDRALSRLEAIQHKKDVKKTVGEATDEELISGILR